MILYLPEIYEDETMYSFLSRSYEKGGYVSQTQAMEEFLKNPKERLEFAFCNDMSKEIVDYLTKKCKWEDMLNNHTLCNYYGRYLDLKQRVKAMQALRELKGNYANLFSITPIRNGTEYLRYCPMCVKENRNKYGETYWNRLHQVPELTVCPKHKCKLLNSTIKKDRHKMHTFNTAENNITNLKFEKGSDLEIKIAEYIREMVCLPINVYSVIHPGQYLISQMESTKYLSNRGKIIKSSLLYSDMIKFYKDLDRGIQEQWQISKVLHEERINPYEIIQIGLFLNISPEELIKCQLSDKKPEQNFDDRVIEMLQAGKSTYRVAKDLYVSTALINLIRRKHEIPTYTDPRYITKKSENTQEKIVKLRKIWLETVSKYPGYSFTQICETSEYKLQLRWLRRNDYEWTEKHFPQKCKSQVKNKRLEELDKKYFPQMDSIIADYKKTSDGIPKRVTVNAINKFMGLNNRDLYNMKKCSETVKKYEESQEEFWARKILWALSVIEERGGKLGWNSVKNLVHISNMNFYQHKDYFSNKIGKEVIDMISPR